MATSRLAERLDRRIEAEVDDLVSLTRDLIRIESTTGMEGPVQAHIAELLRKLDFAVDVFEPDLDVLRDHPAFEALPGLDFSGRPNVVATWKGAGGGRSLLLNGHVDTIPVGPLENWRHPPFSGAVADGRIFGRGTSDMKGGVAVMLMALRVLRQEEVRLKGDVIAESVVDEELTGYGTLAAIVKGYRADAGICLETSDLCVQPGCVGRLWFTLRVRGRSAALTRHWEGESAIDKSIRFVQAFKDLEEMRRRDLSHPLYPDNRIALPCAVFMFNSGTFPSAVPDFAELRGSLGLLPHELVEDVKLSVRRQIAHVAEADPWLRQNPPDLEFKDVGADGAEIPVDHPIVQAVVASYRDTVGAEPEISGRVGGADTRYLIKYGETPTVIFGPGLGTEMHSVNESVPIDYLVTATKVVARSIVAWCGVASG